MPDHIETKVIAFIDGTLMGGQGSDLTATTPLFEFGILDSFALFTLISFIAEEFQVTLQLESLKAEEFETAASIAQVIRSRLEAPAVGA